MKKQIRCFTLVELCVVVVLVGAVVVSGTMALNMFMSQVLSPDGADIGVMVWREGSCLNCTVRANPAEVKGLSMAAAALIPVATSGSSSLEDMFAEFLGKGKGEEEE